MTAAETENVFLIGEYEQAWEHYRHLENSRAQYLGFFFTASLGSAALAAPVLAANAGRPVPQLFSAIAFLAVFEVFTFFVLVTVRRLGGVLRQYEIAMAEVRTRRVELLGLPAEDAVYLSRKRIGVTTRPALWLSVQRSAEGTLTGFVVAGDLLIAAAAVISFTHQLWLVGGIACAGFVGCGVFAILSVATFFESGRERAQNPR